MHVEAIERLQVVTVTQVQSPTVTADLCTAVCLPTDARFLQRGGSSPTQVCGGSLRPDVHLDGKKNTGVQSPSTYLSGLTAGVVI